MRVCLRTHFLTTLGFRSSVTLDTQPKTRRTVTNRRKPTPRLRVSFAILRTRRKGGAAVAFLRTVDCDDGRGGDDEEYHDEGGVALAGLALGPGIVNDLLVGAKKVAHHGVGRHRSRRRCARRVVVHDRWFNCKITERVKSAHVFFASYSFFRGDCLPCAEVLEI